MKRRNESAALAQTQVRMSKSLKILIRAYQKRLRKETGVSLNFSATVRVLIEKGLASR